MMADSKATFADVRSNQVGPETQVGQFTVVEAGARIGAGSYIGAQCWISGDAEIGDRVALQNAVHVDGQTVLESDVVVFPRVVFAPPPADDSVPRPTTRVGRGARIGAGSTILAGVEIGSNAVVEPGSVVTRNVPPNAIVSGNPVQIIGYVRAGSTKHPVSTSRTGSRVIETRVAGVSLLEFPRFEDVRGSLVVGEFEQTVPFVAQRFFVVFGVPSVETRGEHAHRACHQFLICLSGSCSVVVDDGENRQEIQLNRPDLGLHLPPMVWGIQYRYTPDAVVLVFASDPYDPADYIRDYDEFLQLRRAT